MGLHKAGRKKIHFVKTSDVGGESITFPLVGVPPTSIPFVAPFGGAPTGGKYTFCNDFHVINHTITMLLLLKKA